MSKKIWIDHKAYEECVEALKESLDAYRGMDGKVTFSKVFGDDRKTNLYYTPDAWAKQTALVNAFSTEVAWHGVCKRVDGGYLIEDILVYPQTVTGVTVDMDVEKYAKWLFDNSEDERFDHIFAQGHSHVNMGTTPSATDLNHQKDILDGLSDDGFYVFVIFNKRNEHFARIYDMRDNALYDTSDITVSLYGSSPTDEFVKEAKKLVLTTPASYTNYAGYTGKNYSDYTGKNYSGYTGKTVTYSNVDTSTAKGKEKPKGRIQNASSSASANDRFAEYGYNFDERVRDPYGDDDDGYEPCDPYTAYQRGYTIY